jgi:hypothetical protein
MTSTFLPRIPKAQWDTLLATEDDSGLYDLLAQPLHEELYKQQSFGFMEKLSVEQQMVLAFDYIQSQTLQGGFLQLIQNKYISLLLPAIEGLKQIGNRDMVSLLDDVLKVYVLNHEALEKETTVQEFAALYNEFKEFELLDGRFGELHRHTLREVIRYATLHPEAFAIIE